MKLISKSAYPTPRPAGEYFTGQATITGLLDVAEPIRLKYAVVAFEPAARTFWHVHRGGQVLAILEGRGRVQTEGEPIRDVEPGDLVYFAPGEKHWHGAQPAEPLIHAAFTLGETDWLEEVTSVEVKAGSELFRSQSR
jgi:quercetin dioxygenase-like cupin family protein